MIAIQRPSLRGYMMCEIKVWTSSFFFTLGV